MVSNMENESILGPKKAKNLGKILVSNGFQIWKWYFVTKIVLTYCEKKLF